MKQKSRLILLLPAVIAAITFSCNQRQDKKESAGPAGTTSEPATQQPQKAADKALLVGDWTRTDAPYQIKISELSEGGMMKAGYFNPRSINVAKATWDAAGGTLKIYIELRDENYPGSNYNLTYIPEQDLLAGKYFQAVEGVTYDVGFKRAK